MAYDTLTRRRPNYRYADIIRAETPGARERYFRDKSFGLSEQALQQSADQFDQSLALSKKQAEDAQLRNSISQGISSIGVAKEAYPYAKKAVGGIKGLFPSSTDTTSFVDPALEVSGPASTPVSYDAGSLVDPALEVGGYSAGEAAIGSAAPSYTSPAIDALLADSGTEAAVGVGEAAIPSTGGTVAAGEAASAGGSALSGIASGVSTAVPYYALAKLGGQIGNQIFEDEKPGFTGAGYGKAVSETLNRPLNVEQYVAEMAGAPDEVQVGLDLLNPLAPAERIVSDWLGTHLCTLIKNTIGMSPIQQSMMAIFKNWCIVNHSEITQHYLKYGGDLVDRMKASIEDRVKFCSELKKQIVDQICTLMAQDRIEEAADIYKAKYLELLKEYAIELFPGYAKAQMPGD